MGGTVAVILRDHQGKVTPMLRWTNIMPYFFRQFNLFSNDVKLEKNWIKNFMKEHDKMKKDYEKNKDTSNFEFDMTDTYFPYDTLAPYSYGLIVVDFLRKKLYTNQNYCSLEYLYPYNLKFDISNTSELKNLKLAYKLKALDTISIDINNNHISYKCQDLSFNEFLEFLSEINDRQPVFSNNKFAELNQLDKDERENLKFLSKISFNSPWIINEGGTTLNDFLKLKESLIQDEFVFTEDDNTQWITHLALDLNSLEEGDPKDIKKFKSTIIKDKKATLLLKELFNYDLNLLKLA